MHLYVCVNGSTHTEVVEVFLIYVQTYSREELKKCRTHKRQLQSERDSLFKQMEEQESNK